jgi:hypothetical protein
LRFLGPAAGQLVASSVIHACVERGRLRSWLCTCLTQLLRVARLRGVCISICAGAGGDPMKFLFFTIIGPNNNAVQVGSTRSAALGRGGPLAIVAPMGMQMWIVSRGVGLKGGIFQAYIISREPE